MNSGQFFSSLWREYVKITPQAEQIRSLFLKQNKQVINDHVAFRTFDLEPFQIEKFEPLILGLEYNFFADYQFPNKHLYARSYIPKDKNRPKIFISQILCGKLSRNNQKIIDSLISTMENVSYDDIGVLNLGRLWRKPSWQEYQSLLQESEYAAWLSAMGLRANHFTISIDHLSSHTSIAEVNRFLKSHGFILNSSGGEIKGSPQELLEQSSTLADSIDFRFADGTIRQIQTCYYEFAKRYPDKQGHLFQGFVSASADKIFESTDRAGKVTGVTNV